MNKTRQYIVYLTLLLLLPLTTSVYAKHNINGELTVDLDRIRSGRIPHLSDSLGSLVLDSDGNSIELDNLTKFSRKTLSSHTLRLNFDGPFISPNFGNYSVRTKFSGAFYGSETENFNTNEYLSFDLNGLESTLNLFSQKRYPLKLFRNKSTKYSIQDEPSLRTLEELGIHIENGADITSKSIFAASSQFTRRYDADVTTYGAELFWNIRKNLDFKATVNNNKIDQLSHFDFGEDKILYVLFEEKSSLRDRDTIAIKNELADVAVNVYIGLDFITLQPLETDTIIVDSGSYSFSISPLSPDYFSTPDTNIYFNTHMKLTIFNITPPPPDDIQQKINNGTFSLSYDSQSKFKNETIFDYSKLDEVLQVLSSDIMNLNNRATYEINQNTNLNFMTVYSENSSTIDTLYPQDNAMFNHITTLTYKKRRGISTVISHSYTKSSLDNGSTGIDTLTLLPDTLLTILSSSNHLFSTNTTIPYSPLEYTFNIKTNISLLKDNSQYENDQYGVEFQHKLTRNYFGIKFTPKTQTKYLINQTQLVDSLDIDKSNELWDTLQVFTTPTESKEFENKLFLTGEAFNNKYFGDIKVTGEYDYRNKFDSVGSDIKQKRILDLFVTRKFGKNTKMIFLTNQEKETYGGTTPSTHIPPSIVGSPRQLKSTYKVNLQLSPWSGQMFSLSYMIIKQSGYKYSFGNIPLGDTGIYSIRYTNKVNKTNISKYGFSFNTRIPFIDLPLKAFLIKENRNLSSQDIKTDYTTTYDNSRAISDSTHHDPEQTTLTFEMKINYSFRKISLVVNYEYNREKQKSTSFSFYEIGARITRQFGIF